MTRLLSGNKSIKIFICFCDFKNLALSKMTKISIFIPFNVCWLRLTIQKAVYLWNGQCSLIVESPVIRRQFYEISKAFRNCLPFSENWSVNHF